ncbi:MAG: hypothetical protein GX592_10525 [Clostridiales bacterium]|nr:hypothetical protein [Clostridiales bacterium]
MRNRAAPFILAAALLLPAMLLGGCAATDESVNKKPDLSVNIVVPYATTTPAPVATGPASPLKIDDGKVTVLDPAWIEADFTSREQDRLETQYTQLRLGDTGENVQNLQSRLKELKYFEGEVSGVFDAATEDAVERFELTYGTMQTGIATAKMQTLLYASTAPEYGSEAYNRSKSAYYETLQRGDVGSSVLALKYRLQELGYPIGNTTGQYDDETAKAVSLFYKEYGFKPNEVAVVELQKELYSEGAKRYSGSVQAPASTQAARGEAAVLSEGNIGTPVVKLQSRLIELKYMEGTPSGTFDALTADAVRQFQRALGLQETGAVTESLQTQLFSFDAPAFGSAAAQAIRLGGYALLKEGDNSDAVRALQTRLVELGYANGTPNGQYERNTISAVKLFQKTAGLQETGVATAALQALLFADDAPPYPGANATKGATAAGAGDRYYPYDIEIVKLSEGSEGELVTYLQTRLTELGFFEGDVDGNYGGHTESAVKKFQKALGIKQTGDASVSLQRHLFSDAAPKSGVSLFKEVQKFETLEPGDSSKSVEKLQRQLWELGYLDRADVDGSIGTYNAATETAVASAQLAMGYVDPDGVAGPEFQAFLFSKYCTVIKKN